MKQSRDPGSHTVLLVDDNRQFLQAIGLRLELDGFDVLASETGDEAIELLNAGTTPDILLTDAVMPGVTQGPDLARYVKRYWPKVPVILMSGYMRVGGPQASEVPQIDLFVAKPLKLSDLSAELGRLLDGQYTEAKLAVG